MTLPMIRRTITTNLMLITLQTLSVFGLIYTMTRGGPSDEEHDAAAVRLQAGLQSPPISATAPRSPCCCW